MTEEKVNIRRLADELIADIKQAEQHSGSADIKGLLEAFCERHRDLGVDAICRAASLAGDDIEEGIRQEGVEVAALQQLLKVAGPGDPNEPIGIRLKRLAEAGDEEAARAYAAITSVENQVTWALTEAAAERHPDWKCVDVGDGRQGIARTDGGEIDDGSHHKLIDWFQLTYPAEAKAVEDRVRAGGCA